MIQQIRVICNKSNTNILKKRLKKFFCENDYSYFNFHVKTYWKEPSADEIAILMSPCPMWSLIRWDQVFKQLFHNQEYVVEDDTDGIAFCSYVSLNDMDNPNEEAYFVIFGIPMWQAEHDTDTGNSSLTPRGGLGRPRTPETLPCPPQKNSQNR